jgi:GNAT superfamily N-acetyltransferase
MPMPSEPVGLTADPLISVRALGESENDQLVDLLLAIPDGEHLFVKHDISRPEAITAWLNDTTAHWEGAFNGSDLVGAVAVVPGEGWSSHVGELRMVVHPNHRRAGIGACLAKEALIEAINAGFVVVTVQALAEQTGVLKLFRGLGFVPESLLTDHVREPNGQLHDLVVLSHSVSAAADRLQLLGEIT